MARRRRNYARDSHGRFARTVGKGGVYKRKMSTRKKVAIGGAVAVGVGAAVIGTKAAYRSGARKGWETGKAHGLYEGRPLRDKKTGRVLPNSAKKDRSRNPYGRGMRPVGPDRVARPKPSAGTRIRATRVASKRIDRNFAQKRRRTEGFHAEKRARDAVVSGANSARKAAARRSVSLRTDAAIAGGLAGQKIKSANLKARRSRNQRNVKALRRNSNRRRA